MVLKTRDPRATSLTWETGSNHYNTFVESYDYVITLIPRGENQSFPIV